MPKTQFLFRVKRVISIKGDNPKIRGNLIDRNKMFKTIVKEEEDLIFKKICIRMQTVVQSLKKTLHTMIIKFVKLLKTDGKHYTHYTG